MKLPFEVKETKQAIIFIGIQASGKSTFYHTFLEQLGYCHINLDTLNTRNKENILMENCFREGKSFVVDNTNPEMADREKYISKAKENGYEIIALYFQSILCDCIARNMKRKNAVPVCAIPGTQNRLQLPSYKEGFDKLYFARIAGCSFEITNRKI